MNKLDISEWKEFSIGELFEVERPTSRTVKQYETGNIPGGVLKSMLLVFLVI